MREDHEWIISHIPKAIHIGRGILERIFAANISDKNTEIILYCGGGFRSALSVYNLQKIITMLHQWMVEFVNGKNLTFP